MATIYQGGNLIVVGRFDSRFIQIRKCSWSRKTSSDSRQPVCSEWILTNPTIGNRSDPTEYSRIQLTIPSRAQITACPRNFPCGSSKGISCETCHCSQPSPYRLSRVVKRTIRGMLSSRVVRWLQYWSVNTIEPLAKTVAFCSMQISRFPSKVHLYVPTVHSQK